MIQVVRHRTVHAEVETIWRILADFGAISAWAPNVDHSSLTTDIGEGVGATRRVQVGRNTLLEQVVEWEPDVALSYDITGLPKIVKAVNNRWTFERLGPLTDVALTSTVSVGPKPVHRIVERVAARQLDHASKQLVDGLAERAEEIGRH